MSTAAPDKPHIMLVSLSGGQLIRRVCRPLLDQLKTLATLDHATEPESALQGLADRPPQAVLVTDGGIAEQGALYKKLLEYVRGGGILVFMGHFSSSTDPEDTDYLFQEAGLSWTYAVYRRSTVFRNEDAEIPPHSSLASSYSQKAVFLAGVASKDAWYLPNDSSRTESHILPLILLEDQSCTPVAFTTIGQGKLGYVGDINAEEESDEAVLAMCGLLGGA